MPVSDKLRRARLPPAAFLAPIQVGLLHFVASLGWRIRIRHLSLALAYGPETK